MLNQSSKRRTLDEEARKIQGPNGFKAQSEAHLTSSKDLIFPLVLALKCYFFNVTLGVSCRSISSIKGELIPFLVNKQFQKNKKANKVDPKSVSTVVEEFSSIRPGRSL